MLHYKTKIEQCTILCRSSPMRVNNVYENHSSNDNDPETKKLLYFRLIDVTKYHKPIQNFFKNISILMQQW